MALLSEEIRTSYVPTKERITELEKAYGLEVPYDIDEIFHATYGILKGRDFDKGDFTSEEVRKMAAYKSLASRRDLYDLILNLRLSALKNPFFGPKSESKSGPFSNLEKKNLLGNSLPSVISLKEKMKNAVRSYIIQRAKFTFGISELSEEHEGLVEEDLVKIQKHNDEVLKKNDKLLNSVISLKENAFSYIDQVSKIKEFQINFFNGVLNLDRTFKISDFDEQFLRTVKLSLELKDPQSVERARSQVASISVMENRFAIGAHYDELVGNLLFPFKYSYGTSSLNNDGSVDSGKFIELYLDMLEFEDDRSPKHAKALNLARETLRSYLKNIDENISKDYELSQLVYRRSVSTDIHSIVKLAKMATRTNRKIEEEVVLEFFSRKDAIFLFDSDFLDLGLEYIVPRLKNGVSPKEVVDKMLERVAVEGILSGGKWRSLSGEIYPSKVDLIRKALGEYLYRNEFTAKAISGLLSLVKISSQCSSIIKRISND